jgi:hypothetical protein
MVAVRSVFRGRRSWPFGQILAFADEYTAFRVATFQTFRNDLCDALDAHNVRYEIHSLYPILLLDVGVPLAASLYEQCRTFSLAALPGEPELLRLFPTPTNREIVDHIRNFFDARAA